jgi:hypothetical protein
MIEKEAAAIFAHRSSQGVDLLSPSQEYLAYLMKLLADQSSGTPQVSNVENVSPSVEGDDIGTLNKRQHKRIEPTTQFKPSRELDLTTSD